MATSILSRRGIELGQVALLAAVYISAAKLSLLLAVPPGYATAVWPPSGIALAAALLGGKRIWPGIWLGAALTNLSVQGSPLLAVLIATGNTLEAVIGSELIRRYAGGGSFDSGHQAVKFIGLSALSASIAAGIGVISIVLSHGLSWSDALLNLWTWWQGDVSGMIVVTPLILSWCAIGWPRWSLPEVIEAGALAMSLALVTFLIFGELPSDGSSLPLAFLAIPFIVWAAVRFTQREVTTSIAIICGVAVGCTLDGRGPFGPWPAETSLLLLLAYTATLAMTGLVLTAVIGERERAIAELRQVKDRLEQRVHERSQDLEDANRSLLLELEQRKRHEEELRESEERFRLLVDGVKDYAIFVLDPEGTVVSWNTGAQNIKGYAASEIIGTHFSRFYTADDLERRWPEHELAVASVEGRFEDEGWRVRKDGSRFWANVVITPLYANDHRLVGFAKVTRDLTTHRRMEAMQETERQMNEFLAMLAHELRNPLAAIVNARELMRRNPGQEQEEARGVIDRQVTHLARIVDDLLDVSRITRGSIALKKEVLDLNDLVARIVESCRPLIDARRHEVSLQFAEHDIPVDADSTRMSQVVLNLVSNAVKYTPEGGRIAITVERESGDAVLRVRDNGIGIPATLLPRVFDLFVQGTSALARTEGGLGIGLTLVKRLIELQGGSVEASSGGAGQGSEFVVRLPLSRKGGIAPEPVEESAETSAPTRRRLLVVDDNRDSANMLAALLEVMGHEVRIANDGATAISLAAEYRAEAVFLDIGLPEMDGYEVARKLRGSPGYTRATLVAFTGYGQQEDRRRVQEAGFDHHLVKPTAAAELIKIIDGLPARGASASPTPKDALHPRSGDTGRLDDKKSRPF